ncbi:SDR family oxidoreductase [Mesorhizobium sp. CGMCC 1.15528]|uniref:SDR family oxidoreductase n=1 Tax=Mesorhizobium zhangyense TaxID=1776730 RepID=A0A7C9VB84_9HYPH|nr:SDR family NAD(P)-dependent oxidoreductase [Mesorhizobium zhangyense]NGN43006.1 SDR family oxidoreductase [Mesorhizobium zhangyense]
MNKNDHHGKIAVITGGSGGIGMAIALRLASEGAQIILWDFDATRLSAVITEHADWRSAVVDVTDNASVVAATKAAIAEFGRIDILVNSAGFSGSNHRMEDYPLDLWDKVIAINLTGVFLTCKAVVPEMARTGYGRVVNIASMAGKEGVPTVSCYSAAKAGVIAFTKAIAREYLEQNICINSVAPSAVETELLKQMAPATLEMAKSKIPMGRFGRPDEVAAMISFLSSDDCSFSTGAVFDLSGGRATY